MHAGLRRDLQRPAEDRPILFEGQPGSGTRSWRLIKSFIHSQFQGPILDVCHCRLGACLTDVNSSEYYVDKI